MRNLGSLALSLVEEEKDLDFFMGLGHFKQDSTNGKFPMAEMRKVNI